MRRLCLPLSSALEAAINTMPKITNKKLLWVIGPVASAALGAYIFLKDTCCESKQIEYAVVFFIGVLAFVSAVILIIRRFRKATEYFRDPKISYPESVFKDHKENDNGK